VLVGGVASFGYWSISQFHSALDTLSTSASNVASVLPASVSKKVDLDTLGAVASAEQASTTALETMIAENASSSAPTLTVVEPVEDVVEESNEPDIPDSELHFGFLEDNYDVYTGCTYQISWSPSTTIKSFGAALVDGGTKEISGPVASGLAKENYVEPNSRGMAWKVGVVWPGDYFISIPKINGVETKIQSEYFSVKRFPVDISVSEKENMCKESGGAL